MSPFRLSPGITMKPPELTEEAKQAIAGAVREIAAPDRTSWESTAAVVCFVLYGFSLPAVVSSSKHYLHYLLRQPPSALIIAFVLLALSAGFGLSAARKRGYRGRITGSVILGLSMILILNWVCYFW